MEARDQVAIDVGNLFPQTQNLMGSYQRIAQSNQTANSTNIARHFYSQWNYGFNLAWEIDFWGEFRRMVESDSDQLDASVENYDDVLVTMLGDVATYYSQVRTFETRIKYAQNNVELQRETLTIVEARFKAGTTSELDVDQARSTLAATQAAIPGLEISLRQSNNQLCIVLGIPPEDLHPKIGEAPIPVAPPAVAVGIPADLLRRRPDVRRAERQAAAQSALIGVAEANFYPHISVIGTLGAGAGISEFVQAGRPERQRRAVVHLEHPQLRANSQQCPPARCEVPGPGGCLSDRCFERGPRCGKRHHYVPPVAGADEVSSAGRRRCRASGSDRANPV